MASIDQAPGPSRSSAIERAVRPRITHLERLAVDTHGYTDFGMAIAKILSLDLFPRLYSLRDRHLHIPRRFAVPPAITGIVQHDVSLELIREGWLFTGDTSADHRPTQDAVDRSMAATGATIAVLAKRASAPSRADRRGAVPMSSRAART